MKAKYKLKDKIKMKLPDNSEYNGVIIAVNKSESVSYCVYITCCAEYPDGCIFNGVPEEQLSRQPYTIEQLNKELGNNNVSIKLKNILIDYFFSSYYLSRNFNGQAFNKRYDRSKAKINKVIEYTLGYCREHNMLHEYTEKKFINKSDDKPVLYIEMQVEESSVPNFYTNIRIYKFIISKNGFIYHLNNILKHKQ